MVKGEQGRGGAGSSRVKGVKIAGGLVSLVASILVGIPGAWAIGREGTCGSASAEESTILKFHGPSTIWAQAVASEEEARGELFDGMDETKTVKLFKEAIKLANRVPSDTDPEILSAVVEARSRAHLLLGSLYGGTNLHNKCISHYEKAHKDPRVRNGELLRERPYMRKDADEVIREHLGMYKHCLHAKFRDDEAHEVFKDGVAHGHWRHDLQCASKLSPANWSLRAQPWWELSEVANGAEELTKALEGWQKMLQKEVEDFFSRIDGPEGPDGVYLGEEVQVNGSKPWLELLLGTGEMQLEQECAMVPNLCNVLKSFRSRFHPAGQVKLSYMTGGTNSIRHCGPCDTKLRMHHAILLPKSRKAEIEVGGITKHWEEGRSILFDDSFEHIANFDADPGAKRVILIADFVHPDVPRDEVATLQCSTR